MGHDEEIGGPNGAAAIAAELRRRNIKAEFILVRILSLILRNKNKQHTHTHTGRGKYDTEQCNPGMYEKPIAFISNAEKGAMNIKLEVDCKDSGHSSQPLSERRISEYWRKRFQDLRPDPFFTYGHVSEQKNVEICRK